MFRTKKDVDKHCEEVFRNIKSERERYLRCLSIAQQYYNVRDYESAKRYVTSYLSVKDDSSVGHKLLAQCHDYFEEKGKALEEYKFSLLLDPKQPELILRVCELLSDISVTVDKNQAKYWQEKGETYFPYHPSIFKLKQKLTALGNGANAETVESIIMDEIKVRPNDSLAHNKLLIFLMENGRIQEAYIKAFTKIQNFVPTLKWYQTSVQICKAYKIQFPNAINEDFYGNYLFAMERTVALSVQDVKIFRKSIPECITFLARFDETLSAAASLNNKSNDFIMLINHMAGQLCYHTANILYRKVKWEENGVQDFSQFIAPLLLLSTSENFTIVNFRKQDSALTRILDQCSLQNTYRISQAGLVLLSQCKDSQKKYFEKIFHFCVGNWKERILEKIYITSDFSKLSKSSFFSNYAAFSNLPLDLPKNLTNSVEQFVFVTETTQPGSLHHLVWLGVQYLINSDKQSICDRLIPLKFRSTSFRSLQNSVNNTMSSYAETLNRIDVDAFLYACVYCAESTLHQQSNPNKVSFFQVLPADVSKLLCLPEHELWWESAYQMANQTISEDNFSRVRTIIQRGIEVVRLMGNNNLPLPLLVLLGRTFVNRAAIEPNENLASLLEARASLYWKAAVPLLKKIIQDEEHSYSVKSMFDYCGKLISKTDAVTLFNEAKRFHEMQRLKGNNYVDNLFHDETTVEFNVNENPTKFPSSGQQPNNDMDEEMLCKLMEQNTKIMDRLDTLFYKQELLSSNQLQLHKMVSVLAKKIDDFVIDSLTQAVQPLSPQNQVAPISTTPVQQNIVTFDSFKCIYPAVTSSMCYGNYPPPSIQTNFPMYQPTASSTPPCSASSYLPHTPPSTLPYSYGNIAQPNVPVQQSGMPTFNFEKNFPTSNFSLTNRLTTEVPKTTMTSFASPLSISPLGSASFSGVPLFSSQSPAITSETPPVSGKTLSFASPSSIPTIPTTTASSDSPSHSFQIKVPALSSIVISPSVDVPEECDDSDDDKQVVEHDPLPDFKPIIPLPEEITVTTGEEDEEVLFESRVKLFRFADKEWKERGIGMFKILKNRDTRRVRVLMRREIVHKICANHFLSSSMTLTPMINSDRAWIYCAPDFADEKTVIEKLCVKFKTPEIAADFKKVFDKYKAVNDTILSPKKSEITKPLQSTLAPFPTAVTSSLHSTEKAAKKIIMAPSSIKLDENKKTDIPVTTDSKSTFGGFTFNSTPIFTNPEKKEQKNEEKPKSTPFSSFSGFGTNMGFLKPATGSSLFSTKVVTSSTDTLKQDKTISTSAPFASVHNTVDFSTLRESSSNTNAFAKSENFKGFVGAGSLVFGSSPKNKNTSLAVSAILKNIDNGEKTPVNNGSVTSAEKEANESQNDNVGVGEFIPTAEFEPVVPLPDLVEVKTGEEGLNVLYEEHCKLFRYVNNEWKERGIGKLKILQDPKDGSVRMLMRRDQVHKVCCNQRLSADIELKPLKTNNKAWTWSNQDFSEGELRNELLCVRFKTMEQAEKFKNEFEHSLKLLSTQSKASSPSNVIEKKTMPTLAEQFKRDPSTWECKMCYVVNKKEDNTCVACLTAKDGTTASKTSPVTSSASMAFGMINDNSKPKSEFKFGIPSVTTVSTSVDTKPKSEFKFGTAPTSTNPSASVFSFGSIDSSKPAPTSAPMTFSFGTSSNVTTSASTAVFSFGTSTPPTTSSGPIAAVFSFGNNSSNQSPQKSVSGGSLFGSPVSTESKSNETGLTVKPKENISIFSGSPIRSTESTGTAFSSFSFKLNENQAPQSKFTFGSSSMVNGLPNQNDSKDSEERSSLIDEVEFVSETQIPEEEKKLAESLKLPSNYFAYKYSNRDCPGCQGCDLEDLEVKKVDVSSKPQKLSVVSSSTDLKTPNKPSFVFGASANTSFSKGAFIFNNSIQDISNTSTSEEAAEDAGSDDEKVVPNDKDPYFDPIIPLPEVIETKTGEEEEEILFRERAKLFRYDESNKEWKERGVGDLKVLHHPRDNTYRLLLRREQVHKVVLNQRISPSLSLQPLSSSKNSLCWFGMNLPEESDTPKLEKLAARFKTEEIMKNFEQVVSSHLSQLSSPKVNRIDNDNQVNESYSSEHENTEKEETYKQGSYEYNGEEYNDYQQNYVDEHGIQDAMQDVDYTGSETETLFETAATLQILKDDTAIDYPGVVKIFTYFNPEIVEPMVFVEFSTDDVPELYTVGITEETVIVNEGNTITFPSTDESESESKRIIHFENDYVTEQFLETFEKATLYHTVTDDQDTEK